MKGGGLRDRDIATIYDRGREAFWNGRAIWGNPHLGTEADDWREGWRAAFGTFEAAGGAEITPADLARLRPTDLPKPRARGIVKRGMGPKLQQANSRRGPGSGKHSARTAWMLEHPQLWRGCPSERDDVTSGGRRVIEKIERLMLEAGLLGRTSGTETRHWTIRMIVGEIRRDEQKHREQQKRSA